MWLNHRNCAIIVRDSKVLFMKNWFRLFRVNDYIKNVLIFFPAFFGGRIFAGNNLALLGLTFLVFSLLSSAIYIINDLLDFRLDSKHPLKKARPLADGRISTPKATLASISLIVVTIVSSFFISPGLSTVLVFYLLINLAYSLYLKHFAPYDLLIIALGFLLRIQAGGIVSSTEISWWLYVMIFLFAISFGFAKRLEEIQLLIQHQVEPSKVRPSLRFYSAGFLQQGIISVILIAYICYVFYTLTDETISRLQSPYVFVTCLPVTFGVYHYIVLVRKSNQPISPQAILRKNLPIQLAIFSWLVMMIYFIYRK